MEDKPADSQNELSPDQDITKFSGGPVKGAPPSDEPDAYSIGPVSQSDSRSGGESVSNRGRNSRSSRKNRAAEDPEQGSSDSQSTSSTTTADLPQWTTKPRITIIDVDSAGKPTRYPRVWGDDLGAVKAPDLPIGGVRIILKEVTGLNEKELSELKEDIKKAVINTFPRIKQLAKTRIAEITRPALDTVLESPTTKKIFQYALHRKFSVWHLQKILRSEMDGPGFILQTDLQDSCFPPGIRPDNSQMNPLLSSSKAFHSGDFGLSLPFWEAYTAVKFDRLRDGKAYAEKFEDLLHSTRSALKLSTGKDTQLTCQLILLDLMRSVWQCWDTFFQKLNLPNVMNMYLLEPVNMLEEFEKDVDTSSIISSTIRDSAACASFLISSIEPKLNINPNEAELEAGGHYPKRDWDSLYNEVKYLNQELQDVATDLVDRSNRELSFFVANLSESQADSARRLTIVASIFLPLTLSASLMAMTTHVRSIGDLWYDWVGLCLVTGTIILVIFSVWKHVERATFRAPLKAIRPLLLWIVDEITVPWGYYLLFVVTASFLVGMFHTKRTALEALGYGFAGIFALAFLKIIKHILSFVWKLHHRFSM